MMAISLFSYFLSFNVDGHFGLHHSSLADFSLDPESVGVTLLPYDFIGGCPYSPFRVLSVLCADEGC